MLADHGTSDVARARDMGGLSACMYFLTVSLCMPSPGDGQPLALRLLHRLPAVLSGSRSQRSCEPGAVAVSIVAEFVRLCPLTPTTSSPDPDDTVGVAAGNSRRSSCRSCAGSWAGRRFLGGAAKSSVQPFHIHHRPGIARSTPLQPGYASGTTVLSRPTLRLFRHRTVSRHIPGGPDTFCVPATQSVH